NIRSRVYLMASTTEHQTSNLNNQEFENRRFDVDVWQFPCGLTGALYFSRMDADGESNLLGANKAGATYGTGYLGDAQCKFSSEKQVTKTENLIWCS
ncbi:glycoside hydrolase, partial [Mycena polygramma]